MRHLKLILEYDGADFHGWQVQPGQRTVQGVVEGQLRTILGEEMKIVGAGRTDAGVHARGQVAHCHTHSSLALGNLLRGLNSLLPHDVAARRIESVSADFHARYSASYKIYSYTLLMQPEPSPLLRRLSYHARAPLDVQAMRQGARLLLGCHDFSAFWGGGDDGRNPDRTVRRIELLQEPPLLRIFVEADSFLRHMVRNIVGTLLEIGRGRFPADWVGEVLQSRDRTQAGPTARAKGLCLEEVVYPQSFTAPDWGAASVSDTQARH